MKKEDLNNLIERSSESKNLDYKGPSDWESIKHELTKDVLAMSNVQDGGAIVIGISETDSNSFQIDGLTDQQLSHYEVTKMSDFFNRYADPTINISVRRHIYNNKKILFVFIKEFSDLPIVCKRDYFSNGDRILQSGQLYIRTDSAKSVPITSPDLDNVEEMRRLVGLAVTKKGDEILTSIEKIISGKPLVTGETKIKEYDKKLQEFEKEASSFFKDFKNYGYWEFSFFPSKGIAEKIDDFNMLRKLVNNSKVSLRGWDFPHLTAKDSHNFQDGIQGSVNWMDIIEIWRCYKSLFFAFRKIMREDAVAEDGIELDNVWRHRKKKIKKGEALFIVNTIYLITELHLFCRRLFENVGYEEEIGLKIKMGNTTNRMLVVEDFNRAPLSMNYLYKGSGDILLSKTYDVVSLKANFVDAVKKCVIEIFQLFNWNDPNVDQIEKDITNFLNKKFS